MRKGKMTREMILDKASALFNSHGYFGSSMSDIMAATGLEKGGIYNHFGSKEELALAAFDHMVGLIGKQFQEALTSKGSACEKLIAFIDRFAYLIKNPIIPGGCPLLNCAVESDDAHPALKERAARTVNKMLSALEAVVDSGIKEKEIADTVNSKEVATLIVSCMEGSIMLTKLLDNYQFLDQTTSHLKDHIRSISL